MHVKVIFKGLKNNPLFLHKIQIYPKFLLSYTEVFKSLVLTKSGFDTKSESWKEMGSWVECGKR